MDHILIPKHTKLTEKEKQELFEKYGLTLRQMPNIHLKDPGLEGINVKPGDVVKIERKSPTAKETIFYRSVIA